MARKSKGTRGADSRQNKGWLAWVLGSAESYEGYFEQSRSLTLSFVLIAPLLIVYEAALIYYPAIRTQGAGGWVRHAFSWVFHSRAGIAINAVAVAILLVSVVILARRRRLRLALIIPMVLESAAWAAAHMGVAIFVMRALLRKQIPSGPGGPPDFRNLVSAVGAGVYEEVLFRLLLTSFLFWLGLQLFEEDRKRAAAFAVLISSLIFAVCHISAPVTRTDWMLLVYFFCCGLVWSAIYVFRGLGVAAYAHVFFDIVAYLGQR